MLCRAESQSFVQDADPVENVPVRGMAVRGGHVRADVRVV